MFRLCFNMQILLSLCALLALFLVPSPVIILRKSQDIQFVLGYCGTKCITVNCQLILASTFGVHHWNIFVRRELSKSVLDFLTLVVNKYISSMWNNHFLELKFGDLTFKYDWLNGQIFEHSCKNIAPGTWTFGLKS